MGKHSRRSGGISAKVAATTAVTVGVSAAIAPSAHATDVVIPNTNVRFNVEGLENIPNIANVPGISEWVPSLAGQATAAAPEAYNANVDAPVVDQTQIAPPVPEESTGEKIVDAAASKIGSPYVYGAAGPSAFDCSGLTSWSYKQVGIEIPRTSYAQAAQGQKVSYNDLQPGDIVAFYSGASHVGIYTGHGTVIHASTSGKPLAEVSMAYMPFHSAVRFT
ncbi:MAG: NlpC/P60 family protein [Corynebacterium sp.]|nr:NlpC/P60 family protein [Corynebacterium sp.]